MTLEALKEKARLTDKRVGQMWRAYNSFASAPPLSKAGIKDMFDDFSPFFFEVAKAQQDKDFKAFLEFCKENNIYQVSKTTSLETEIHHFKSVKEVLND